MSDRLTLPLANTIFSPSFIPKAFLTSSLFVLTISPDDFKVSTEVSNSANLSLLIPVMPLAILFKSSASCTTLVISSSSMSFVISLATPEISFCRRSNMVWMMLFSIASPWRMIANRVFFCLVYNLQGKECGLFNHF